VLETAHTTADSKQILTFQYHHTEIKQVVLSNGTVPDFNTKQAFTTKPFALPTYRVIIF
jgi:hypothetical protein